MGKTKTVFVEGESVEKTGKEAYEERRKKKATAAEALAAKGKVAGLGLKGGERIKVMEGGPEIPEETSEGSELSAIKVSTRQKAAKVRSQKYQSAKAKIDRNKLYKVEDAIKLIKETSYTKFDGTLEMHLVVRKTGQSARVELPYSTGKSKKIEVADDSTVEKLIKGKIDFDILLSTADMMPKLVPFAKLLGPRGLMPNPKTGTIIKSNKDIDKFSGNTLNLKTQKDMPVMHTIAGKVSQKDEELTQNINAILDGVGRKTVLKAYLKSTMSPSAKLLI